MVIAHNLLAYNSNRMLGVSTGSIKKSTEKLSSGYKINRAADDAAGLTISEKMRSQIRGLTKASENAQDGVSFCQIADGALDEVHSMLKRCQELSIQAANGTNTDGDRQNIQQEIAAISKEIDRVHESSIFNELRVFPDSGNRPVAALIADTSSLTGGISREVTAGRSVISFEFIGVNGNPATVQESKSSGSANPASIANSEMAGFVVDAAASAVSKLAEKLPSLFAKASSSNIQIGLELSPQSVGGTLATASIYLTSTSSSSVASYKMWVDTADYPIDKFPTMTAQKKADLAATIAHEMTHLVMDDTLTSGMLGVFPKWFKEGTAQMSSGDNGWLSGQLNPSSSDDKIRQYKAQLTNMPYGAGYAASMYLAQVASGKTEVNNTNIAEGLDKLFTQIAENIDSDIRTSGAAGSDILDRAINTVTNGKFTSVSDFQNKFTSSSDDDSLRFMKDFLNARGTGGAGSMLDALSKSEEEIFAAPSGSYGSYKINKDNKWYANAFGTGFVFPENLPSTGGGGQGNDRNGFILQVGAANRSEQQIFVKQFSISNESLFDGMEMDVSTVDSARFTIGIAQEADARISAVRSYYGAMQNRLEHTIANLDNVVENTTAAESQIRDTDMAKEMVNHTKTNILIQAGNAMLSQAMQTPQNVLQLLS